VKILGGIIWDALEELEAEERAAQAGGVEDEPATQPHQEVGDEQRVVADRKSKGGSLIAVFIGANTALVAFAKLLAEYEPFCDGAVGAALAFVCAVALTAIHARRASAGAAD
jgi:hypothetical protein